MIFYQIFTLAIMVHHFDEPEVDFKKVSVFKGKGSQESKQFMK